MTSATSFGSSTDFEDSFLWSPQAIASSACFSSSYIQQHTVESGELTPDAVTLLAVARLEWLLQATRRELSGLFTEDEVCALMDCFQADFFFPDMFNCLGSYLCNHLGIELDELETSRVARLVSKLRELTPSQRATLADALEQAWHRGLTAGQSPRVFFATLGIDLL